MNEIHNYNQVIIIIYFIPDEHFYVLSKININ